MREIWELLVPTRSASSCWLSPLSIRNLISNPDGRWRARSHRCVTRRRPSLFWGP